MKRGITIALAKLLASHYTNETLKIENNSSTTLIPFLGLLPPFNLA